MVEAAVIRFTVEKLGNELIEETLFLLDVRPQFKKLRDELRRMQCFLKDADAKQQGDERVRNWVADIRNVAYDAEDVIDTFILKMDPAPNSGKFRKFKWKALMFMNLKYRDRVGRKIQDVRCTLKEISDSRATYAITNLGDNEASSCVANQMIQQQLRNHYLHVEDHDVIGSEENTTKLLTELVKDDEQFRVVSIVGVGGLGKTTLAKKIYKHDTIKNRFDCRSWCSISQQLNLRNVLLETIKNTMNLGSNELKDLDDKELIEKLYKYLQDRRYLIVVDDFWHVEDWITLSPAFPKGKIGSKILLTTRNKNVASQADPTSLQLEPKLLSAEDSWELLCTKAFPRNTGCSPGLEKLGKEMVRKCGGLPLAICVLGGLLATRRAEIKEWEYVNRDIISSINKGKNGGVTGILELSYNDLPIHLKPCFLYLGLFPEDYAIPRKKLIRLWTAEGFIQHTNKDAQVTLEDVGKYQYYAELIQRCMIQPDKDTNPWKKKSCRMHDLMRDLCLSKSKEMNFLDIYNHGIDSITSNSSTDDTRRRLRRYAIHLNYQSGEYDGFYFNKSACALRTLLVINSPSDYGLSYQHIKLLRVLDLGRMVFHKNTIKVVSKLIHLRYLVLGNIKQKQKDRYHPQKISSSIGNLRNLQTLMIRDGLIEFILPDTITKLEQLRHLEIETVGFTKNFRVENLINLQTLRNVKAGKWIREGCFAKLSNLRNLSVSEATPEEIDVLIHEIISSSSDDQYQNPIRDLSIQSNDIINHKIFDLLSCCHNLHRLKLLGRLEVLNLQKYPPNLTKLTLVDNKLPTDPMKTLQYLPSLTNLYMLETYTGEEMVCSAKGFPQLQTLNILDFHNLKKWTVEEGGMPRLKQLCLCSLKELIMLPEGLRLIATLRKLSMVLMPKISDRVAKEVGEDWYKVQHIPYIDC